MIPHDSNLTKTRIKAILDADPLLVGKTKDFIRTVLVGTPPNKDYADLNHPAIVITNAERWMEEKHRGPDVGTVRSSVALTARYDIILVVQMDDYNEAEKEVDRFWVLLEKRLYDFITLELPTGGSPLCKDIIFERTRRIPQLEGQEIDGFIATLTVLVDPTT